MFIYCPRHFFATDDFALLCLYSRTGTHAHCFASHFPSGTDNQAAAMVGDTKSTSSSAAASLSSWSAGSGTVAAPVDVSL